MFDRYMKDAFTSKVIKLSGKQVDVLGLSGRSLHPVFKCCCKVGSQMHIHRVAELPRSAVFQDFEKIGVRNGIGQIHMNTLL